MGGQDMLDFEVIEKLLKLVGMKNCSIIALEDFGGSQRLKYGSECPNGMPRRWLKYKGCSWIAGAQVTADNDVISFGCRAKQIY